MRHISSAVARTAVFAALAADLLSGCASRPDVPALSLWRDGSPARAALLDYVAAAEKEGSPGYLPPEERIAVFDFDGTLFCETDPTYIDWMLFESRVLDDPSFTAPRGLAELARAARETGAWPGLSLERERAMAEAWRGLTPGELAAFVREFMQSPQPGFTGMKRGEAYYRPMVEVVRFLRAHGFIVYVCSGTDRMVLRPLVEDGLDLPPGRIIGSDSTLVARAQDGRDGLDFTYGRGDELVMGGECAVKNLQMNKVAVIAREIGARPVLAFGNSMSDASMLNYTVQDAERRTLAFMILCDDTAREYGDGAKAERMRAACAANGWTPVSMRDDWKTIYGDGVARRAADAVDGAGDR